MEAELLGLITAAAAAVTNGAISLFTLAWPARPRYTAAILALLVGVSATFLAALAYLPATFVFDRQSYAALVLSGLFAGFAAGGLTYTQNSAETARGNAVVGGRLARIYNAGGGKP